VIRTDSDQEGTEKGLKGRRGRVFDGMRCAVGSGALNHKRARQYGHRDSRSNLNPFELQFWEWGLRRNAAGFIRTSGQLRSCTGSVHLIAWRRDCRLRALCHF
jgi:hypothetical protein